MTQAAQTAATKMSADATFEPEFLRIFVSEGLEVALAHLAEQHDLDVIEAMAIRATIEGLVPVTSTGT